MLQTVTIDTRNHMQQWGPTNNILVDVVYRDPFGIVVLLCGDYLDPLRLRTTSYVTFLSDLNLHFFSRFYSLDFFIFNFQNILSKFWVSSWKRFQTHGRYLLFWPFMLHFFPHCPRRYLWLLCLSKKMLTKGISFVYSYDRMSAIHTIILWTTQCCIYVHCPSNFCPDIDCSSL